ncbi:class A beta-lactamase [Streptomyces subrutilus]|uniref:Beta-lactamase n=1 Tax=Streptomyces subrutilus TaxID=36818 RepID=A0A1E5Q147_9ACTN|nr:class A beta-lactamase [Streptomyces subrutilus]
MVNTSGAGPSRRALLALGTGTVLFTGLAGAVGVPAQAAEPAGAAARRLRELEREHSARLGVFARDTATGRTVAYRADERFPMCSVFKGLAAAAVLRDLDEDGEFLARRIRYTREYVEKSGYGPETGKPANLADGMTVEALCAAAVSLSDNAAANLLLEALGGPAAITRFSRSLGDRTTRLDRWEPELNSAEPGRITDTTSPRAIGGTYARLLLGDALPSGDRGRLTGWLVANTTNTGRFKAGLPADWILADKTGGGNEYGVANDVGVVWPPGRAPIVMAVLTTKPGAPAGPRDEELVAKTARLLASVLT